MSAHSLFLNTLTHSQHSNNLRSTNLIVTIIDIGVSFIISVPPLIVLYIAKRGIF